MQTFVPLFSKTWMNVFPNSPQIFWRIFFKIPLKTNKEYGKLNAYEQV